MSRLSRMGLPLSIVSSTASRRECFCTCRARAYKYRARSYPLSACHAGCALRAAVDGSIHVLNVALRNLGQRIACRRIAGGLVFAAQRLNPRAADELFKPAMVPLQPRNRFLRIFRRGAVLHGVELFRNAHSVSFQSSRPKCSAGLQTGCRAGVLARTCCLRDRMPVRRRVVPGQMMLQLPLDIAQHAAGADPKQRRLQPRPSQLVLHQGQPVRRLLRRANAARRLESHRHARPLGIVADRTAPSPAKPAASRSRFPCPSKS